MEKLPYPSTIRLKMSEISHILVDSSVAVDGRNEPLKSPEGTIWLHGKNKFHDIQVEFLWDITDQKVLEIKQNGESIEP